MRRQRHEDLPGAWAKQWPDDTIHFENISPARANATLRTWLAQEAYMFRSHDFLRGHALDLQSSGCSAQKILEMGPWRSPTFLQYLDLQSLEREAVIKAHLDESSDEDCDRLEAYADDP